MKADRRHDRKPALLTARLADVISRRSTAFGNIERSAGYKGAQHPSCASDQRGRIK
jgi:hypothetical protein